MIVPVLGIAGRILTSRLGLLATAGGAVYADKELNDGKLTEAAAKKVVETGSKVIEAGAGATADKLKEQFTGLTDKIGDVFGEGGSEFIKENWGKMLLSAVTLGLVSMENTRSAGIFVGLCLAGYVAYQHLSKDSQNTFNTAAADATPAPSASLNAKTTAEIDPKTGKPKDPLNLSGVDADPNNGVIQSERLRKVALEKEQRQDLAQQGPEHNHS